MHGVAPLSEVSSKPDIGCCQLLEFRKPAPGRIKLKKKIKEKKGRKLPAHFVSVSQEYSYDRAKRIVTFDFSFAFVIIIADAAAVVQAVSVRE